MAVLGDKLVATLNKAAMLNFSFICFFRKLESLFSRVGWVGGSAWVCWDGNNLVKAKSVQLVLD